MRKKPTFPVLKVLETPAGYEGVVGFELRSILSAALFYGKQEDAQERKNRSQSQQESREAFLHSISSWPQETCLEMHLAVFPNLKCRVHSRLSIAFFVRTLAESKEKASEDALTRFIALSPLLRSHFKEAEFAPVTDALMLDQWIKPFHATHALAVHRRVDMISLSKPLKRLSLGFGPMLPKEDGDTNLIRHLFPWVPSLDSWHTLLETMMGQLDPLEIIVRLRPTLAGQDTLEGFREAVRTCEDFLSSFKNLHITLEQQTRMIRDVCLRQLAELSEACFELGVFILAPHQIDLSLANVLGRAITGAGNLQPDDNFFRRGFLVSDIAPEKVNEGKGFPEDELYTVREAASAFRLPAPPEDDLGMLPIKRFRTSLAGIPFDSLRRTGAMQIVVNEHQGQDQAVFISPDDRMRHVFIDGQTGTGKSTLMEAMILQDIRAGRGVGVIDPHGDLVESIIGKIPTERLEEVILFDLLESERPMGFNVLQWRTLEERDLIIDELYLTLDRVFDMRQVGGPIFESNFRGMLKMLMGEKSSGDFVPTILDFTACYLDDKFRKWLKGRTKDPQTLDFVEELEKTGGDASLNNLSPYVTSKFSRFVHDRRLRRIVGQEKTAFDLDEVINERKIFLVSLGKGRFGSLVSAFLANQLVSRFKLAAMKRGGQRPQERTDFFLYVDECHNLPAENFCELLSEARKYRMGLTLATQYTALLHEEKGNGFNLLSAIFGNVGTTLIFRVGQEDAVKLSPVLFPNFSAADIIGLPNYNGYARFQPGGTSVPPFSFKTEMDKARWSEYTAKRVREIARTKYGADIRTIHEAIMRRRSIYKQAEKPAATH
jgi:hypothetical protein